MQGSLVVLFAFGWVIGDILTGRVKKWNLSTCVFVSLFVIYVAVVNG